jgi:NADH dehydrogenase FAD-containing subunit
VSAKIVILGGSFAGLSAAGELGARHHVTLVDRRPDFEFLPNVHEIVSGLKTPRTVRLPRAAILAALGHRFVEAEARAIDLDARTVAAGAGELPFDALILACGGEVTADRIPGAAEHAVAFRSAAAAAEIAERMDDLAAASHPAWISVVGGGLSGVEVLGELLRRYRKKRRLRFRLVQSGPRLMEGWPRRLHRRVLEIAEEKEVDVLLGARVSAVEPSALVLANGPPRWGETPQTPRPSRRLPSHLTVWATGTRAPRVVHAAGLVPPGREQIPVRDDLSVPGRPGVFVAGDLAAHPRRLPRQAARALEMGVSAARNAERFLAGRPTKRFRPDDQPIVATFGDLTSFLVDDGEVVEQKAFGALRELIFQEVMAELDPLTAGGSRRRQRRRFERLADSDLAALAFLPWTMLWPRP